MNLSIPLIPRRALCAALVLIPLGLGAAGLEPGAELPALRLSDQFDQPVVIGTATRILVFTAEKPASDLVIKVLGSKPKGAMESSGLVYVADISAMPAVISRIFALPKLRELSFTVALAREAGTVADLPRRAGFVTVLPLKNGRITQILYVQTETQLLQAMEPKP